MRVEPTQRDINAMHRIAMLGGMMASEVVQMYYSGRYHRPNKLIDAKYIRCVQYDGPPYGGDISSGKKIQGNNRLYYVRKKAISLLSDGMAYKPRNYGGKNIWRVLYYTMHYSLFQKLGYSYYLARENRKAMDSWEYLTGNYDMPPYESSYCFAAVASSKNKVFFVVYIHKPLKKANASRIRRVYRDYFANLSLLFAIRRYRERLGLLYEPCLLVLCPDNDVAHNVQFLLTKKVKNKYNKDKYDRMCGNIYVVGYNELMEPGRLAFILEKKTIQSYIQLLDGLGLMNNDKSIYRDNSVTKSGMHYYYNTNNQPVYICDASTGRIGYVPSINPFYKQLIIANDNNQAAFANLGFDTVLR